MCNKKFVFDNVSELSFNAFEENRIIRLSYGSNFDVFSLGSDKHMLETASRLGILAKGGRYRINVKNILSCIVGLKECDIHGEW